MIKKICTYNSKSYLIQELSKKIEVLPIDTIKKPDLFFIEWYPPIKNKKENKNYIKQLALLKFICTKIKVPLVIFDRFLSLDKNIKKELKKYKVKIYEPSIFPTKGSYFLPPYINTKTKFNNNNRKVDLGIINNDIKNCFSSFKKYYLNISSINPEYNFNYKDNNFKENYKDNNLFYNEVLKWSDIKYTIFISRKSFYKKGFFDSYIIDALDNGCVPLLPPEHRFYYSIFKQMIVYNKYDINFFIKSMNNVREILIYDIYENIEKEFPEFTLSNICDKIIKSF